MFITHFTIRAIKNYSYALAVHVAITFVVLIKCCLDLFAGNNLNFSLVKRHLNNSSRVQLSFFFVIYAWNKIKKYLWSRQLSVNPKSQTKIKLFRISIYFYDIKNKLHTFCICFSLNFVGFHATNTKSLC